MYEPISLAACFFHLGALDLSLDLHLRLYLVSLARSEDINKYGLDVFLTPFVGDLKT